MSTCVCHFGGFFEQAWRRNDLTFASQREPRGSEEYALYAGHVVVVCSTPRGDIELMVRLAKV